MGISSFIMKIKIEKWKKNGLVLGKNVEIEKGCSLDPSFPWLISIGNNVTIAPEVCILAHDASMKYSNGKTKLGKVKVGDNVFIGTKSIILPGITIGNNTIIGAASIVTSDVPDNVVVCGSPAKIVSTINAYNAKNTDLINKSLTVDRRKFLTGDVDCRREVEDYLNTRRFAYIDYK